MHKLKLLMHKININISGQLRIININFNSQSTKSIATKEDIHMHKYTSLLLYFLPEDNDY